MYLGLSLPHLTNRSTPFMGETFSKTCSPSINSKSLTFQSAYSFFLLWAAKSFSWMHFTLSNDSLRRSVPHGLTSNASNHPMGPYQYLSDSYCVWPLNSITHARSISSKTWTVHSDWPSVWGWNAVLRSILVPNSACNVLQNIEVNCVPLSDMMESGTPCNRTIFWDVNFG